MALHIYIYVHTCVHRSYVYDVHMYIFIDMFVLHIYRCILYVHIHIYVYMWDYNIGNPQGFNDHTNIMVP